MQALSEYVYGSSKSSLAKDVIVLASVAYFLNKLRHVKLSALVKAVPGAQKLVSQQIEAETSKAAAEMFPVALTAKQVLAIPSQGRSNADILSEMKSYQKFDANGHDGKTFAYIYDTTIDGHHELIEKVFTTFMHENGLNPVAFPALRKFEVEVVAMSLTMLNAPSSACGTMTSGGTESLLCALKAYRERARVLYPHITAPEVVLPVSAHVAFPKGCALFDLKAVFVPLAADYGVDVAAFRRAITPNTILLVASAPQYPHGIVDPISQLSEIALEKKLPLHVDSCIGGFILPWVEKLGYPVPAWDYRVAGVTSISADLHKYGYAAKGASVLTWRHQADRRHQFFAFSEWPGGLFISPSMLGTRPGGSIASAWASLVSLGEEGFMKLTQKTMTASKAIQKGINEIPGLRVLGAPHMTIVAFESTDASLNILALADIMDTPQFGGYHLERQQRPLCCHLTLMPPHAATLTDFLKNLRAATDYVRLHPELNKAGAAAMYGLVAKIGDGVIVEDFLTSFISKVYSTPAASGAAAAPSDPKESKTA